MLIPFCTRSKHSCTNDFRKVKDEWQFLYNDSRVHLSSGDVKNKRRTIENHIKKFYASTVHGTAYGTDYD